MVIGKAFLFFLLALILSTPSTFAEIKREDLFSKVGIQPVKAGTKAPLFSLENFLAKDDGDIEEIEKVMLDKNIPNHETAAEYWKWMQQSAAPTPGTSYNPSTLSKFDLSKYQKNPVAAARDEAFKALNELRKSPKPIGL